MSEAIAERLRLDLDQVTGQIVSALRRQVGEVLRRSGIVVAMSGGVDSSVCAALAAAAVGARRVTRDAMQRSGGSCPNMGKDGAANWCWREAGSTPSG